MRGLKLTAFIALASGIAGCAGPQSAPGSDAVRLTSNQDLVKGCSFVKQETVSVSTLEALGIDGLRDGTIVKIKNAAAASGANTVVTSGPQDGGDKVMVLTGDLYRCT